MTRDEYYNALKNYKGALGEAVAAELLRQKNNTVERCIDKFDSVNPDFYMRWDCGEALCEVKSYHMNVFNGEKSFIVQVEQFDKPQAFARKKNMSLWWIFVDDRTGKVYWQLQDDFAKAMSKVNFDTEGGTQPAYKIPVDKLRLLGEVDPVSTRELRRLYWCLKGDYPDDYEPELFARFFPHDIDHAQKLFPDDYNAQKRYLQDLRGWADELWAQIGSNDCGVPCDIEVLEFEPLVNQYGADKIKAAIKATGEANFTAIQTALKAEPKPEPKPVSTDELPLIEHDGRKVYELNELYQYIGYKHHYSTGSIFLTLAQDLRLTVTPSSRHNPPDYYIDLQDVPTLLERLLETCKAKSPGTSKHKRLEKARELLDRLKPPPAPEAKPKTRSELFDELLGCYAKVNDLHARIGTLLTELAAIYRRAECTAHEDDLRRG